MEEKNIAWNPFGLDELLKNHSFFSVKSGLLLTFWVALIAVSVFTVIMMTPGSWVSANLDDSAIRTFFLFYPPLLIGSALLFWLGFEWGFIPVFIASFAIAFSAAMPVQWALLFGFSFILGLGIYALAYYCVPLRIDLRDLKSFTFFTVVSLVAAMASSLGSFVWSLEQGLSPTQSIKIWNGWWTGGFFQSMLILAPILMIFTPSVRKLRIKFLGQVTKQPVTLNWIYGAIGSVIAVVSCFVIGGKILGTQGVEEAILNNNIDSLSILQATDSFQVIFWVSLGIILTVGFTGIYLVSAWNQTLQEEVDQKTGMLKRRESELEEAVKDREMLLNEIHGRVNNNLAIILAIFELQLKRVGDESLTEVLKNSKFRIRALSLIHELMSQSGTYKSVNLKSYVSKLSNRLEFDYKSLKTKTEIIINADDYVMGIERAVPVCMILNEAISKVYETVYSQLSSGRVSIDFYKDHFKYYMVVRPNGDFSPEIFGWGDKTNIGMKLIRSLSKQINAEIFVDDYRNSMAIHVPIINTKIAYNEEEDITPLEAEAV